MSNFAQAILKVLKHEGGYANVKGDIGETYRGITRHYHPNWDGWETIDEVKPKHNEIIPELEQSVHNFYYKQYWNRIEDICNDSVAAFVFDYRVNSGNRAIKALQKIVGADVDGILGNDTISRTNNYNGDLLSLLKSERIAFVKSIVKNNPTQAKFLNGWLSRINSY